MEPGKRAAASAAGGTGGAGTPCPPSSGQAWQGRLLRPSGFAAGQPARWPGRVSLGWVLLVIHEERVFPLCLLSGLRGQLYIHLYCR